MVDLQNTQVTSVAWSLESIILESLQHNFIKTHKILRNPAQKQIHRELDKCSQPPPCFADKIIVTLNFKYSL